MISLVLIISLVSFRRIIVLVRWELLKVWCFLDTRR